MRFLVRVMRHSLIQGIAEFRQVYTWRSWIGGWLVRLLSQVAFFGLIGRLLGSRETEQFIVVGNAVAVITLEAMVVIASSAWERFQGTLPLLVASPSGPVGVYLGRGIQWLGTGMVSSTAAFVIVPVLLRVSLPWPRAAAAIPVIAVVGLSSYAFGCFLASVVLRFLQLQWLVLNFGYLVPMTICGVNVPVSYWPLWLQGIADALPLTHGLHAIRLLLGSAPAGMILSQLGQEVLVGCGWLAVAAVSLRRLAEHGRADGSIEFAG